MAIADPFDNAVWHALTGPLARFAEGTGRALRFSADVSPFAGLPDGAAPADWDALRDLLGPGRPAVLFRGELAAPEGWKVLNRMPCRQMVSSRPIAVDVRRSAALGLAGPELLGAEDAPAMLDLATRTQPGPFATRTPELGDYIGVRANGRLVAMAGERLRLTGATEISAVCTDPDHRRSGLAAELVAAMVARIRARGDVPFLHVLVENAAAIRVYEALGFDTRRLIDVTILRTPA
ncbi:MAG TPA: GNAT family N-acetyltransferase [Candidatus Binatia bacterium]|nr:GNAT family N-acetyltransferase [Candidatus Binatia bacterium]